MNIVFLSPHFPPNFYLFCVHLRNAGATVLGIADAPYNELRDELREAMTEYYRVENMENYDELLRACGYFVHRYGRLDRVESPTEYSLETESLLRTDFNIPGIKQEGIARITKKSEMKKVFMQAGVQVAQGQVVKTIEEAKQFAQKIGYPAVLKPDRGVGAAYTFRVDNTSQLETCFAQKPQTDCIMEEFIQGQIVSFDGLTDHEGNIVFYTSHVFSQGLMETVNEDRDIFYYSLRDIPKDLEKAGFDTVNAFGVREKFFHIEFFRSRKGLVGIEVNMRQPGGMTMDMFDFANDIDLDEQWANMVVRKKFSAAYSRPYHCGYVGRKLGKSYKYTHKEIMDAYNSLIVHHEPINSVFSAAIGNYGYLARSEDIESIKELAQFVHDVYKSQTYIDEEGFQRTEWTE